MIRLTIPKAAPGFWPALGALVLALIYLTAFVLTADGQNRPPEFSWENALAQGGILAAQTVQPGVGYPDPSHARFEFAGTFPLNPAAHPWGADGGIYEASAGAPRAVLDVGLYRARYGAGTNIVGQRPIGMWDESEGLNAVWLKLWYAKQPEAHQRLWSGVPSYEEVIDAAMSLPRLSAYGPVFEAFEGGRPETAIVIDQANYARNAWHFRFDSPARLGSEELRPVLGVQKTTNLYGYPRYYDVRWLPGAVEPPPPPPAPVPAPPPPPACESWEISAWLERCKRLKPGTTCEECAARSPAPGTVLAQLRARVCEPICEVRPAPPPTCEQCQAGGFRDPACEPCPCPDDQVDFGLPIQPLPGRHCTPEPPPPEVEIETCIGLKLRYIPGRESTGRLEIVSTRQGEEFCPSEVP